MEKGDLVQYLFDTGATGLQTLVGIVVKAGPKAITVHWESGVVNQIKRTNREVKALTQEADPELYEEAKQSLVKRIGVSWFNDAEQVLIDRQVKAEQESHEANKAINDYFMPLVKAAIKAGDIKKAKAIAERCPSSVTKVFLWDALRQAEIKG
jgi:hypothetical protein